MVKRGLGRPDTSKKRVSNLTREKERQREQKKTKAIRRELLKREAKARGRGLTRLEAERFLGGRAPSAQFGEAGATTIRKKGEIQPQAKITPTPQRKLQPTIERSEVQEVPSKKVKPKEGFIKIKEGSFADKVLFPVVTKRRAVGGEVVTSGELTKPRTKTRIGGEIVTTQERDFNPVNVASRTLGFALKKGTEGQDIVNERLGRQPSKKVKVQPRDVTLGLGFIPGFSSTGFTQSFQTKVIPLPKPKTTSVEKSAQIQSGRIARVETKVTSKTPPRFGIKTTEIGQRLGFKPIGKTQIAPGRDTITKISTFGVNKKVFGTATQRSTTGSRTFNRAFNIKANIGNAKQLTPAQLKTFNRGLLETQKGAVIKQGTQFGKFTTQITKVSPTPKPGRTTQTITGTGASLKVPGNKEFFLTKTASTDITKSLTKGSGLQTTRGVAQVRTIQPSTKTGTSITGAGGKLTRTIVKPSLKTAFVSSSVGKALIPKTAPRTFVSAGFTKPANLSGAVAGLARTKLKPRVVERTAITQRSPQKLSSVNIVDEQPIQRPRPFVIPRTTGRTTTGTPTFRPPTTVIIPTTPSTPTTPGIPGVPPPGTPIRPGTPRTPPPFLLDFPRPSLQTGIGKRRFGARRQTFADVPSFSALAFGIRGTGGTRGVSGLGFKPITPGFSFGTIFQKKKKKKKRR